LGEADSGEQKASGEAHKWGDLSESGERTLTAFAPALQGMIKQEAMKPGKSDHGFLDSEFSSCVFAGFMVSCSNFDFCSQILPRQGF
jgi:hypothetical protein